MTHQGQRVDPVSSQTAEMHMEAAGSSEEASSEARGSTAKAGQGCGTAPAPGPGSTAARLAVLEALQLHLPLPALGLQQARCPLILALIPADSANACHRTTPVNLAKGAGEAWAGSEADQTVAIHALYPLQSGLGSTDTWLGRVEA